MSHSLIRGPTYRSDAARTPARLLQPWIGDRLRPPLKGAPHSEHQRTPPTARAAARAAPSGHCPRTPASTRITATDGAPTVSRRRCAFPTSPPPSLPLPPPLPLPLPPSPPLSLTADSDVPAGLFANLVLRRSVRECFLHQQFQIIHHSK
jgi:hypothetical protein